VGSGKWEVGSGKWEVGSGVESAHVRKQYAHVSVLHDCQLEIKGLDMIPGCTIVDTIKV
jgi:hypothetical protein